MLRWPNTTTRPRNIMEHIFNMFAGRATTNQNQATTTATPARHTTQSVKPMQQEIESRIIKIATEINVAAIEISDHFVYLKPLGNGFPMTIGCIDDDKILITMGGWHEDCYNINEACEMVRHALTGQVRLTTTTLRDQHWRSEIEILTPNGRWVRGGAISYVRFSWKSRSIKVSTSQYPASMALLEA